MKSDRSGIYRFAIACSVIVAVWMFVLPVLSDLPSVRNRIERNRAAGINPTAVFYTDHPGMVEIERTIASYVDSRSGVFWSW
jgi:hypothetical protein